MKTKLQKQEELNEARKLFEKSQSLIFTDFTRMTAEDLRKFRRELAKVNAHFVVMKKRLFGILLKEKGIETDLKSMKVSIGMIFGEGGIDTVAGPAFSFLSKIEVPEGAAKDVWIKHLLGGHDIVRSVAMDGTQVIAIGKLPPREVLLAQLLGMLSAPIRSFLYLLDEKGKRSS